MKKIAVSFFILLFIMSIAVMLYASSTGITGVTLKNGGSGCSCHGGQSTNVTVTILGPDTVGTGQQVNYTVFITGGPLVRGGIDIAVNRGVLDTIPLEGLKKISGELTHRTPKMPVGSYVLFQFRYTAPGTPGGDSIFATGNSVDFTGGTSGDQWRHAINKRLIITNPNGIINNTIPNEFRLEQNYPNPFNPVTSFKLQVSSLKHVKILVYDATGREIETLLNEELQPGTYEIDWDGSKYSSGVYYYTLQTEGYSETRKMVLIK